MNSPSINPLLTTPSSKDSPTTAIFNSLSPIKMISSRSNSQAFGNVEVPSPQPVFATPQNCLLSSKRWKRPQTPTFSHPQKMFQVNVDHAATSLQYPDMTRQCIPMPAAQSNNYSNHYNIDGSNQSSQDMLCRSPLHGVDDFLSIPFEDCENICNSSSISLGQAYDNGCQMACATEIIAAECTKHSGLVNMANMQTNNIPEALQNNSSVCEGSGKEFLVLNTGVSSNLNVGQISSCHPEKNPVKQKSICGIEFTVSEEIGAKGGPLDKELEANLDAFHPSNSSAEHESIAFHREGCNYSSVSSNMNFNSFSHEDECPSAVSAYLLGRNDANLQTSRTAYWCQLDYIAQSNYEIHRNTEFNTNHHDISSQMRDASVKSQITYDKDTVYHSRCTGKRLQFEDIDQHEPSIAYNANSMNLESCRMSETPSNVESLHDFNPKVTMSGSVQSLSSNISCNYLIKNDSSDQSKGMSTAMLPRSCGIGLHLNAIGVPGQMSSHMDIEMPMKGFGTGGKPFLNNSHQVQSQVLKNMTVSRNLSRQVSIQLISKSDDSSFGSKGCNNGKPQKSPDSFPDCHSPIEVKPLDMHVQLEFNDHHITPCSRKRLPFEEPSKSEDSTQTSLGKKRRKASEIEGQKRCNCKRSKCLKLYCDCFAAGLFCNEACACQGCCNNPGHEEMVSSTKHLIESRNPLAFAPKVVQSNGDLQENGDNKHITPPSARHKRGCNCKKSKCLKKYCECYQAGVGCSLGCRCEGCKNAYGTKEVFGDITEIVVEHQQPKDDVLSRELSVKSLEVMDSKTRVSNSNQFKRCSTPSTSLVQVLNVKGRSRLQLCASYHPSSESNFTALSSLESPTSSKSSGAKALKCEESLSIIPYQQFDSTSPSMVDHWNGFTGIDNNIGPSSGRSPNFPEFSTSKTGNAKTDHTNLFPDRDPLSGASSHQSCSPLITRGRFCEGKFIINPAAVETYCNLSDETPEILMDNHSSVGTVKISSPNQKRVSPPKKILRDTSSSFSPGLKSGRKYVLHSIPQFPSLTPYKNNLKDSSTGGCLEEKGIS